MSIDSVSSSPTGRWLAACMPLPLDAMLPRQPQGKNSNNSASSKGMEGGSKPATVAQIQEQQWGERAGGERWGWGTLLEFAYHQEERLGLGDSDGRVQMEAVARSSLVLPICVCCPVCACLNSIIVPIGPNGLTYTPAVSHRIPIYFLFLQKTWDTQGYSYPGVSPCPTVSARG